jgi:hypothetical protein
MRYFRKEFAVTEQELRTLIMVSGEPEPIKRVERYENSQEFVGEVLGQPTEALGDLALAFLIAAGMEASGSCGVACDSNCQCDCGCGS